MQTVSAENLFARSWDLLTRNWVIVIPGLIVAIVTGILIELLVPKAVYISDTGVVVTRGFGSFQAVIVPIISILATIVAITYTTGMAAAAWRTGTATFADGATAFQRDAGKVFTAMLALFVVGVVAALLAIPTLGLSFLALFFLFLYTMAAAVVGEHGGFSALTESYRIATKNLVTTAIIVVVAGAIAFCGGLIGVALHFTPFIGPILSAVLQQLVNSYLALVIVGAYLAHRASAEPPTTTTAAPPPYEPPPPPTSEPPLPPMTP
jgi:hypothetical protein